MKSVLTICFNVDWLDSKRKDGVRVVRVLEKWLGGVADVALKSSSSSKITVEMDPPRRAAFVSEISGKLRELGEADPLAHVTFAGDVSGLDVPKCGTDKPTAREPLSESEASSDTAPAEAPPPRQPGPAVEKELKKSETAEVPPPPDPREVLESICSAVPVKDSRELEAYVRETASVIPALQRMGVESSLWHQHLLLAVDAGYGRTEFLCALARLYAAHGLLKEESPKSVREFILVEDDAHTDGYRETWSKVLEVAKDMRDKNEKNGRTRVILYLDISVWQNRLASGEVKARLRRLNALCGSFLVVFRVPYLEPHVLHDVADSLNDILNVRTVAVPPTSVEDMADYACAQLEKNGFHLADDARGALEQCILSEKVDDSFFGYKTVDKVVQNIIFEKALENGRLGVDDRTVAAGGLKGLAAYVDPEGDPLEALNGLVGMKSIADRLQEVIVQIKTLKELAQSGSKVKRPAIHMIFTGNPGTGKTTVARIVARLMKKEGILRKGHLVEVKGRDLCGEYVGQTAPRTSAICRDAYGSVLFIDEAYSLYRGVDRGYDYGREALDTLVAEMENHRDDLCVIMAGYKDDMDAMLGGNAGLRSRIPYEIEFPNYTRDELEQIFFTMVDRNFSCGDDLRVAVHDFLAALPDEALKTKEFSNARFVRNLYERTWSKAAHRRYMTKEAKLCIQRCDLLGAAEDNEFKKLLTKSNADHHVMGFVV